AEWGVLGDPGMVILLIGLLIVALVGKTLGGVLGAVGTRDFASRLLIGVGMAPRAEVALVIATLGFQQGHISHHVLVVLILTTIGAALLAPVLMIPLARYQQQAAN
ncbi:MAG: cation:proton antiporter, partial [Gammaproteobacteria bacterium]